MRRRRVLQSLAALPAAAALPPLVQAQAPAPDLPALVMTSTDAVGDGVQRYFSPAQFATLQRLAELLVPAVDGRPGAKEAEAARFLDFLLSQSPEPRQSLYRIGLERLEADARQRAGKPFAQVTPAEAEPVLASLRQPWTYDGPSDPLARFLAAAKADLMQATINSRPWAEAMAGRSRSGAGVNTYWLPIE